MSKLHPSVISPDLPGLDGHHVRTGKVRDSYALREQDKLVVVASDRISIFDFVLRALVPQKGAILTAMNTFWRRQVFGDVIPHDLVASGSAAAEHLPPELRDNLDLLTRTSIVDRLDMLSCEAIARGCLTGSGLKAYDEAGRTVCGHRLPPGLEDGDELPYDIFTPSTKAEVGHDEHITADWVAENMGPRVERLTLQLFALARRYAKSRGIVLADTKFEWGVDADGALTLGDEVLTPDSSRFWDLAEWERTRKNASRRSPTAFDKQFVREWGKRIGIDKRDPANSDDVAWVHAQEVPPEVLARTTQLYRYIFWRLTGQKLERFQRDHMSLSVPPRPVRIEVLAGGGVLDQGQMTDGLNYLKQERGTSGIIASRHIVSWQDNPEEVRAFAHSLAPDSIVIVGGRKVTALPGILRAHLVAVGKSQVPVIGVAFEGDTAEENQAARLAIEYLPGRPVILRPDGKAYFGAQGFKDACVAAVEHEFLPTPAPVLEPAILDIPL